MKVREVLQVLLGAHPDSEVYTEYDSCGGVCSRSCWSVREEADGSRKVVVVSSVGAPERESLDVERDVEVQDRDRLLATMAASIASGWGFGQTLSVSSNSLARP